MQSRVKVSHTYEGLMTDKSHFTESLCLLWKSQAAEDSSAIISANGTSPVLTFLSKSLRRSVFYYISNILPFFFDFFHSLFVPIGFGENSGLGEHFKDSCNGGGNNDTLN